MNSAALISLSAITISVGYYAATIAAAWKFRRRAAAGPPALPKIAPRVALLKPLHGLSDSLADDLLSFMEIDYPRKEYLFGVSSYDDPAAQIPLALKARYQFEQLSLTVGGDPTAINRKIGKLIRMVPRATRADVFVLSDADISVEPDYLRRVIGDLYADDRIGLVTCAYRARPPGTDLGARLEALYINTDFMPMAILADSFEPLHYAFGATIAIRRKVLEEIGGFEAVKDLLADDFHLGNLAVQRGYRIGLSSALVTIVPGERSFHDFWYHQLRWARTYRTVRPISLGTILTHGPFWAALLMISRRFDALSLAVSAGVIGARLLMGSVMIRRVAALPLSLSDLGLLLVKDFCITGIWFASLMGRTVRWGQREFKVTPDGRLQELTPAPAAPHPAPQPEPASPMTSSQIPDPH